MEAEEMYEAVEQLVERRRRRRLDKTKASDLDEEEEELLSSLLSQMSSFRQRRRDDLTAEIRKVKRQNTITHCLLSALIVITAAWQLSEASLLIILKNRLTNPFKSAFNLFNKILKGGDSLQELQRLTLDSNQLQIEGSLVPPIAINMPSLSTEE